jgi:N utilization substance protein A
MPTDEAEQIARLFAQEVPEIAAGIVEIKAIARKPGVRSKLALQSRSPRVDALGACVGVRGCRIRKIVDQLGAERIDLILWDDSPEKLIAKALQPAQIEWVILHPAQHRATVIVREDQLSLTVGRGDVNRELASRLCGWEIEVVAQ